MTAQLERTQFLYGGNSTFVEELYAKYVANPNSVDASWQQFFEALGDDFSQPSQALSRPSWAPASALVQLEDEGLLGPQGKAAKAADRAAKGGASPEEARRTHYGESEERGTRGQASREETEALLEEGIGVLPLPLPKSLQGPLQ